MAMFWCTEALPLAVTAMLPVCLFPTLGILPSKKVCPQYFLETNFLFLSGLVMASSIEEWGLHRRIALKVLSIVGVKPAWWENFTGKPFKREVQWYSIFILFSTNLMKRTKPTRNTEEHPMCINPQLRELLNPKRASFMSAATIMICVTHLRLWVELFS